jgi:hypothetical protein
MRVLEIDWDTRVLLHARSMDGHCIAVIFTVFAKIPLARRILVHFHVQNNDEKISQYSFLLAHFIYQQ